MRKNAFATAYAIVCTLLLITSAVTCFATSCFVGLTAMAKAVIGLASGVIIAPLFHEIGHVAFAKSARMDVVYCKAFCFAMEKVQGKTRLRLVSPFRADETQVIPKSGENMQKRACRYTLGGLILSGVLFFVLLTASILVTVLVKTPFGLWGTCVYTGYLFLLNAMPLEYASGKTDALVYKGIKKGYDAEKVMLSAMTVQGEAYAGKRYGEIEEKYYFDLPVLAEDEPLFALITELRYRYYIDVEDFAKASFQMNRLAGLQPYLTDEQTERFCAELVFLHSVNGDLENAEACGKLCQNYLKSETATAKRVLATFISAFGDKEKALLLKEDGIRLLEKERIAGERLFEEKLLARI